MKNYKFSDSIIILFSIAGIFIAVFPGKTVRVVLESIVYAIIAFIVINNSHTIKRIVIDKRNMLMCFFYSGILIFIHSCFVAEEYEQWRYLFCTYLPILILPWLAILSSEPQILHIFIKRILVLAIPLSFVFFLLGLVKQGENLQYVNYASFAYFLILILPYVKLKWKVVIVGVSIISFIFNIRNRTNSLCIGLSYLSLPFIFFAKNLGGIFMMPILKFMRYLFFFIPLLLTILAYTETFNVFVYLEEEEAKNIKNVDQENKAVDSRTGIYADAVAAVHSPYDLIFGTSVVNYFDTHLASTAFFGQVGEGFDKGRMGGAEAAILNFFQWGGLAFTIIVFIIFWTTSSLAIFNSNSIFLKLIGLAVSSRWFLFFIEFPLGMNFTWLGIFIMLGISLSPKFRAMTDTDIEKYFSSF